MDLDELAFRFWQSPVEKLFHEIRSTATPRIEVPLELSDQLDRYLSQAVKVCTRHWDNTYPVLYRARKNEFLQFDKYEAADMGPPSADCVSAGRAQLAGVSMLYLADTVLTAITEVRPDVKQYVTIGSFKIKPGRQLKVLDLARFRPVVILAPPKELEDLISLSRYAFSAPVHPGSRNKYQAQAYFVQKIRDMGFDGIGYESAVHAQGRCYAFFDASHFRCTRTQLHQVQGISIQAEPVQFSLAEKQFIAQQKKKNNSKKVAQ